MTILKNLKLKLIVFYNVSFTKNLKVIGSAIADPIT